MLSTSAFYPSLSSSIVLYHAVKNFTYSQICRRNGFFLPFKAPAFRHKSLVMLIERFPKVNTAVKPPSMDYATAECSCSSAAALRRQLWFWMRHVRCYKSLDLQKARGAHPALGVSSLFSISCWAPKLVWNFPLGKYHLMPCLSGSVHIVWALCWLAMPGWVFWGVVLPPQGICKCF